MVTHTAPTPASKAYRYMTRLAGLNSTFVRCDWDESLLETACAESAAE